MAELLLCWPGASIQWNRSLQPTNGLSAQAQTKSFIALKLCLKVAKWIGGLSNFRPVKRVAVFQGRAQQHVDQSLAHVFAAMAGFISASKAKTRGVSNQKFL
jgi:hypothetical protein